MAAVGSPIPKKRPYGIVGAADLAGLSELVNREVAEGYEPIGAPFMVERQDTNIWCQAIYKRSVITPVRLH